MQREHRDNVPGHDGSSLTEQPTSDSPEPEPQSLTAAPPDVHAASSVPPSSASDTSTAFAAASHSTASSDATENEPAHSVEAVLLSDLPTSEELSSLKACCSSSHPLASLLILRWLISCGFYLQVDEVRHYAQSIGVKNTKSRPKFELLRIIEDARRGKDPNSVDTSDMVPDMPSTARELRSFNVRTNTAAFSCCVHWHRTITVPADCYLIAATRAQSMG